jgi:hypothetical protein
VTITVSAANFDRAIASAAVNHPIVLPTSVPANAAICLGIMDRTGSVNFTAVADNVNGAHTIINQTLPVAANSVNNALMSVKTAASAGATTATPVTSGNINSQVCAGWVSTDALSLTLTQDTAQATGSSVPFASNAITIANGSSGVILGFLKASNSQASVPSGLNAGAVNLNDAADAGSRAFMLALPYSGNGTYSISGNLAATSPWVMETFALEESSAAAAPSITSIDGDDELAYDDVAIPIVGTDFDTATVTFEQTGGVSVSQSIGSQSATLITLSSVTGFAEGGALKNGAATARVTNADLQDDTHAFTITPPPLGDIDYIDVVAAAASGQKLTALPALASGDQVEWTNVTGSGGYTVADVTVYDDHTVSWTAGVAAFDVRYYDNTAKEWSAWVTQTVDAIVTAASTGAGRATRKRQRYYVEVDGQNFPVDSRAEAEAILRKARELARKDAEAQSESTVRKLARKPSVPVVGIPPPVVTASPELELAPLIAEIEALYRQAAENAELRLRMALAIRAQEQEDEDELLLLL